MPAHLSRRAVAAAAPEVVTAAGQGCPQYAFQDFVGVGGPPR
ncbi:hypothetical protein [Falsiroseomonas sp.]